MNPKEGGPKNSMVVFKWGGRSVWMTQDTAASFVGRDRKRPKDRRNVAYVVRCRLKPAPEPKPSVDM